jgi:hypothetical protein
MSSFRNHSSRMPLALFVLFILVLINIPASAQKNDGKPVSDNDFLRRLKEVEWPKAYREQDSKLLDRILAEEFQMIGSDGAWSNKLQQLERVRTTKPSYDEFRFEIKRLDIFENGTAIIAGTGHGSGKDKDGKYKFEYQSSNILIKRNGEWKAIASHVSGYKRLADDR